ncbi:MAG: alpha/beta fold hydrolase [Planctomycetota bacterium]|jgi:pimeloyl-ACP methyl ester carboxylesterase
MVEAAGLALLIATALVVLVVLLAVVVAGDVTHPARHTAGYAVGRGLPVDPGEAGLSFEPWDLERPDGVRLPVWEATGEATATSTVVFVHDLGESRIDVLAAIEPWPRLAGRLILYDRRGHGDSTGRSQPGRGEGDDLAALIEHLGESPLIVVGQGLGNTIAATAAADQPAVRGLVVIGPFSSLRTRLRTSLVDRGCPAWLTAPALVAARLAGAGCRALEAADLAGVAVPVLVVPTPDDEVTRVRALVGAAPQGTLTGPEDQEEALREFASTV